MAAGKMCGRCGAAVGAEDAFCTECGAAQVPEDPQVIPREEAARAGDAGARGGARGGAPFGASRAVVAVAATVLVAAAVVLVAAALGRSAILGPTAAEEREVQLAVERYVQSLDRVGGGNPEVTEVRERLRETVTERYWETEEGRALLEAEESGAVDVYLAANFFLGGWELGECCADGQAVGVAEIRGDYRLFDLAPDDLAGDATTEPQSTSWRTRVELVRGEDDVWRVAWVEEIEREGE